MKIRLNVLSDNEWPEVHEASMRILSETGLKVISERAVDLRCRAGADVDKETGHLRFPRGMVEGAIGSALEKVTRCGRLKNDRGID